MENAFYYFFSATPQVLGAILALFGVFVIFKIQNIKSQLYGIATSLLDVTSVSMKETGEIYGGLGTRPSYDIISDIKTSLNRNDIVSLKVAMDKLYHQTFSDFRDSFNSLYKELNRLIIRTLVWSIYTCFLILVCLGIITFGPDITSDITLLYSVFFIILFLVTICFYGMIKILVIVLSEGVAKYTFKYLIQQLKN